MTSKFQKGFSLVELLVVIAIIGILAAVGITAYSGYTKNAKAKAALSQFSQVEAVINAELARCAVGEGNMIWGTAGTDLVPAVTPEAVEAAALLGEEIVEAAEQAAVPFAADVCGSFPPVQANVIGYINGGPGVTDSLQMTNPYDSDLPFASAGTFGVQGSTLGGLTVFCGNGGGTDMCELEVMQKATGTTHDKIQILEY